jgi:signal transduction histidine kinase
VTGDAPVHPTLDVAPDEAVEALRTLADELQSSRMRMVEASDAARRRLERDLHDGAQQRFVSASLTLALARRHADGELAELLRRLGDELEAGLAELRELAHGIHPQVLSDRGLRPAVEALAARAQLPVFVEGDLARRPAASVESALYFTVAEALTNVAKYADATEVTVTIIDTGEHAEVEIRDNGRGGADPAGGSGLRGLIDRLGALGGHMHLDSRIAAGTTLRAVVPLDPHDPAAELTCGCCREGQCRCGA